MVRLPVSGMVVELRLPNGEDELALLEGVPEPLAAAAALLRRLAVRQDGQAQDWAALTITDFEVLLLHLRKMLLDDHVSSHAACPTCGEQAEISFRISDYLAAIRPKALAGVTPALQAGWLQLGEATFRLPSVADVLAARAEGSNAALALQRSCVAPGVEPRLQRRLEQLIARLAPQVTGEVGGACPACGVALTAWFDVAGFVLTELRRLAAGTLREVHLLATVYHWAEAAILALPGHRRRNYAELIHDAQFSGAG